MDANPTVPLGADPWEFKVVRGRRDDFVDEHGVNDVLVAEAPAGWDLVARLDDRRIVLGRPVSARAGDATLSVDPYRTDFRHRDLDAWAAVAVFALIALLLVVGTAALT